MAIRGELSNSQLTTNSSTFSYKISTLETTGVKLLPFGVNYLTGLKNASYGNGYAFQQNASLYINQGTTFWSHVLCASSNLG